MAEWTPQIDPRRFANKWCPGLRAVIRPEGWALIISKNVCGQKRRRDWRRFWCYVAAILTAALLCTMAWMVANYHPEKKVSEAVLSAQPEKGAPARDSFPASGANPTIFSVYATFFHGRTAADGSTYDHFRNTAASNRHKLGTVLLCKWQGREVEVVVTDRMAKRFKDTRIDLSGGAMLALYPGYDMTDETATQLRDGTFDVLK